jgi:hypothetical protein
VIIVEGPDGGGKTTLLKGLEEATSMPVAPRAVNSDGRGLTDLREYVLEHLRQPWRPLLLDRFALISGPIYGAHTGMASPNTPFADAEFLQYAEALLASVRPIIIYCLPPLETVLQNLEHDSESQGVVEDHITAIYYQYVARFARDSAAGMAMLYDYTSPKQQFRLIRARIDLRVAHERIGRVR